MFDPWSSAPFRTPEPRTPRADAPVSTVVARRIDRPPRCVATALAGPSVLRRPVRLGPSAVLEPVEPLTPAGVGGSSWRGRARLRSGRSPLARA